MSLLQNISFFPYSNWWRLGGKSELKNQFGGICTLLLIVLIGVIFGMKLAEVFNKTKMAVSPYFQQQTITGLSNFTTFQNDPGVDPFMVAIDLRPDYLTGNGTLTPGDFNLTGVNIFINNSNTIQQRFQLQNCTINHFSKVANITQNYNSMGLQNWMCLPINQTYYLGGDTMYKNQSFVQIEVTCKTNACKMQKNPMQFFYYILKSAANPYNDKNPITHYISSQDINFITNYREFQDICLDFNNIITDNSLLPQSDLVQSSIYSFDSHIDVYLYPYTQASSLIYVQRSRLTYTYTHTYQKLLDAVSYIGGIFQSVFAIFIFVQLFNVSYFQMKFASLYFKCKEAKDFYFFGFLKQAIFDALHQTRFQPQWKQAEVRRKVREAVVSLQDIIYINRRVEFLQKAINVLLQKHQLKGLRLLQNKMDREVITDYKSQNFRDRFIYFLKRKNIKRNHQPNNQNHMNRAAIYPETEIIDKQHKKHESGNICQKKIEKSHKKEIEFEIQHRIDSRNSLNELQTKIEGFHTSQTIIRHEQVGYSQSLDQQSNNQSILDEIEENELMEYNSQESDNSLIQDIEGDLKRLISEGEKPTGDKRSKKIYQQMEGQLRERLKIAIAQFCNNNLGQILQPIKEAFSLR